MANYFLNDDGSLTKKNKKKKGNNYILNSDGTLTLNPNEKEELTEKESIKPTKRTWFNTDTFKDGYQFGDVTKSVTNTVKDIKQDVAKGILGIGEGAIDFGAYLVGGGANILGAKDFAESTKKFIAKDLIENSKLATMYTNVGDAASLGSFLGASITEGFKDKEKSIFEIGKDKLLNEDFEKASVLGDKSDSLVQSGGQLLGTIGLQAAGVPWWLTTGVTSFAGGTEEAFKDDSGYGKAGAYGLISAGAEILTEKISGGISFGGKTLDTGLKKLIGEKITSKTLSTLTKFGLDAVGEGGEEVLTEVLQNVGKKLTYEDEKTWNELLTSEEAMDSYLESFIGGAVLGGGMNTIKVSNSIKTGRDYDTGLTDNEQKIVDKEVETRKQEAQKEGKALTKKEIAKIEEQVKSDLQKGYISTDLIESEFGGEEYNAYKSALDKKTAIESEIKELENKPYAELTVKENERLQAIREELKGIDTNTLKSNLESSMANKIAKDGYLQNSYTEKNKKSVKFNADLTKYDAKQQETIQKAIDSGILNDTNKTHEFVDMIAKISADKGVSFDFANNQKLKDSGFAIEGKQVNGFVNENGITLNMDSSKALNKVVGHEITHILEGTELYTELENALMEYDITKKEYGTRYNELKKLYKGVKDADIKKELTADLVGDYIFNDPDFVNNLSTKKPNVFKKIYDEIKYLFKIATAGSKEARQLEKVKKIFEDAYRSSQSNVEGTKYSIKQSSDGSKYVNIDTDQHIFEGKTVAEQNKIAKEYILNTFRENGLIAEGNEIKVNNKTATKYTNPRENISDSKKRVKNRISTELDNLLNVSQLIKTEADQKNHAFAKDGWEYYLTTFKVDDSYFTGVANVGVNGDTRTLYDINQIKKTTHNDKVENTTAISIESSLRDNTISQNTDNVKFSLTDNQGRTLTKEQQEYFKDSKVRDEEGHLLEVYHGTNADFNVFNYDNFGVNGNRYGTGFYFTDDIKEAEHFTNNETIKKVYLNIKKPLNAYGKKMSYSKFSKILNSLNEYARNNIDNYNNEEIFGTNDNAKKFGHQDNISKSIYDFYNNSNSNAELMEAMFIYSNKMELDIPTSLNIFEKATGNDGMVGKMDNGKKIYVTFNSNQIKNVDNTNPTSDADIRYSLGNQDIAPSRNDVYGSDIKLQVEEAIAPLKEEIAQLKEELAPVKDEYRALTEEDLPMLEQQYEEDFKNIDESNMPIEAEDTTPEIEEEITATKSLEEVRDFDEIGSRKVKAYQYENPEVMPYFQEMATYMLGDLENSVKVERNFNDQLYYDTAGEQGFYGTTRQTTEDIAELLDSKYNYTYKDIRKGLEAIIKDHGAENIAVAKRIELALDKRLREGYTDVSGHEIPANEDYLRLMEEKEIENYYDSLPIDESMIPPEEDIAPVVIASNTQVTDKNVPIREQLKENSVVEEKPTKVEQQTAQILDERPTPKNKDRKLKAIATVNLVDKGYYISKLARQTDNRQLDALWDNTLLSNAQAQEVIGEGRFKFNEDTKTYDKVGDSVYEIFEGLETTNKVNDFNEYMYHKLNIERMSLEDKAQLRMKELKETTLKDYTNEDIDAMAKTKLREDAKEELVNLVEAAKEYKSLSKVKNKPVFGFVVDANKSIEIVNELEQSNPEFSDYAKKVYDYESGAYSDLSLLVESGILSQEDANYYRNKYESYVPIIRDIEADTMEKQMFGKRASVGNAVKGATGGSQNIIPLKDAMAIKTMLVQRSANMNKLGLELMYALNPVVESETVSAENIIEDISGNKDLIQAGTNGKAPTMTVYEHGVKKTFEIPVEIYEALKPNYDSISKATIKPLNAFSNFKRNVLTQYSPLFIVKNGLRDIQDVLLNSQHPARTYRAIPEAIAQLKSKGYWYKEMQAQGLFQDTYYDNQGGFDTTKKGMAKIGEFYPLKKIAEANDFIERIPRIAEYIASREAGKSIEEASLNASRVTTNFKAGGEWTKFFNRNGATFLNASVQGATQQVRNIQEAHQKGLKGYMNLATRYTIAALPAVLLNSLLWGDDDEYEELSDYIKDNYYIIGKYGDGQFIRIPKGRMTAVIQKSLEEMQNLVTGNDEADLGSYLELVANNLAPSNPIENNIFSPFINTKLFNNDDPGKTWYGGDLVPTRLQSKPAAEQYDETTDEFSKWLGEKLNLSPIKINNLIDQNTGFIGDFLLPTMTAEAKTKNDNPIMAGIEDSFTADVVFDNKYSTDFYSVKEKLTKKSNSYEATDEDILKTKYMNSKQAQMNDIYAEIRDVQNSDLDKKTKYAQVRDLREQLNDIAETSLNDYKKVNIESSYAKVGDIEFRKNDSGEWQKITSKQLEKQTEAINTLGASANNYWENKDEYDYAIENPTKYNAISQIDTYDNYIKYKDDIANIKEQYEGYSTAQRKVAVQEYIESLNLSVPKKIMLEKLAGGYSIKAYEGYMFEYIESLPMSAKEKQELHKQLFD